MKFNGNPLPAPRTAPATRGPLSSGRMLAPLLSGLLVAGCAGHWPITTGRSAAVAGDQPPAAGAAAEGGQAAAASTSSAAASTSSAAASTSSAAGADPSAGVAGGLAGGDDGVFPCRADLTDDERAEVEHLLRRAEWAIEDDHLSYPAKDSALDLYERVRILDPGNDDARRGLERIVERYLALALEAARQRRFSQAQGLLDRARLVDPDHPGIGPTAAQVNLLAAAQRRVIPIDAEQLSDRDPTLTDALRQAGLASRSDGCRAEITARSDAEGRWIYQQMSQRGAARIQAQLNIGSPPRIEVMCFSGRQ